MKHTTKPQTANTPAEGATSPVLFADRQPDAAKATRPLCTHVTPATKTKPEHGCRLPRREGSELCVNHQPIDQRLSVAELRAIGAWLLQLEPEQLVLAYVRAVGLTEAKRTAMEQTTAPGSN